MIKERTKSQTPFRRTLRQVKKNKFALVSFWIIVFLYTACLFADFLSPYFYDNEDRFYSYCPPTPIQFRNAEGKFTRPFVYGMSFRYDEFHKRIYEIDKTKSSPIRFFVKGDKYKLLWLIPSRYHLFGVDSNVRLYLWGADSRGRDLFTRILWGSRISLSMGLFGVLISISIGVFVGGISGYYSGRLDNIIMRICEMMMMIPGFYLMLALRAAFSTSLNSTQIYLLLLFIFSFIGWPGMARVIRGLSLSLRQREYVLAAKTLGLSDFRIITRHIVPHTLSYVIVVATISIPGYILGESGLSFLGLGIMDPVPSWGNLLSEAMGIAQIKFHPWILLPGLFIFITVMTFNLLGDALRDAFDPMFKAEAN